jgi:hypothetical protein
VLQTLALVVVLLSGLFLVTLGAATMLTPVRAAGFLLAFAATARTHFLELAIRAVAGGAFIVHSPRMPFPTVFGVFGWTLLLTTAGLAILPWRWHRAFALRAVPYATRHLALVGVGSLLLGGIVLAAVFA